MTRHFVARSVDELATIAKEVISIIPTGSLILMIAEMGAGKTTLSQAICRHLGVEAGISSPTYAIVNQYGSRAGEIYHIDLYRLDSLEEALAIGIEDYLYPEAYTIVEWPQVIESILPDQFWRIDINVKDGGDRHVSLDRIDVTLHGGS